jgi:hypothetical protein
LAAVVGRNDSSLACSGDVVAALDSRDDVAADTDNGADGPAAVEYRVTVGAVEGTGAVEAAVVEDTGAVASAVVAHTAWTVSEMDIVVAVLEADSTAVMAAVDVHSAAAPLVVMAQQRPFA